MKASTNLYLLLILTCVPHFLYSQENWTWEELPAMPEPVANNAVVEAFCGDSLCVYSFCGVDSTKSPAGIHLKAWRYNTVSELWSALPEVPDTQGKIAAGASVVNNKIYLFGGYYVEDNFSELSSSNTHIFDPETNEWLPDGAPIPVATDDHVQAVWRDSLIYLVTGWSDVANISDVQIYDPAFDSWQVGDGVPSGSFYRAFGASGSFVGDTLYYFGGVSMSFNANDIMRKGCVNPQNPTEIGWDVIDSPDSGEDGYRMASVNYLDEAIWIGGAGTSYNFDGVAYDGSGGVEPLEKISIYDAATHSWTESYGVPFPVMDLRGIAQVSANEWIICGGMMGEQMVSDRVFFLRYEPPLTIRENIESAIRILQNGQHFALENLSSEVFEVTLSDNAGRLISNWALNPFGYLETTFEQPSGIYFIHFKSQSSSSQFGRKILLGK